MDNKEWIQKLSKMSIEKRKNIQAKSKKRSQKVKDINSILINDYYNDNHLVSTEKYYNDHKLAWPITKTAKVKAIIIHHTL